ncbi:MAG: acetylglutamate kinase, partial [Eggerthellaceae bacterium]|nr:acetylglutamate kinase [Eggerthellaceae bacterium]
MKYAKDTRAEGFKTATAEVIVESLPWIKNITGKTVVIKYGGSAMVNQKLRDDVMNDIVLLKIIGVNPVIVHGGGYAITELMEKLSIPVEFKRGLRVTSDEVMEITKMVLVGKVNQELVESMNKHGNLAVGVSGSDAGTVMATQLDPELGRVGVISSISATYLEDLIDADYIPVIASVALGEEGGFYNVNADLVAGEVAATLGAHKVIFLTDVDGLYEDFANKESLISNLSLKELKALVAGGSLSSGMIPKVKACINALEAGVFRAHIINGCVPHSLLLELLTNIGIGTTMHSTDEACTFDAHPLGNFAS